MMTTPEVILNLGQVFILYGILAWNKHWFLGGCTLLVVAAMLHDCLPNHSADHSECSHTQKAMVEKVEKP